MAADGTARPAARADRRRQRKIRRRRRARALPARPTLNDLAAALGCLAGIAQAEPESESASEVFLIAQDDDGNTVGETVYASSVSVPA
jgi:hypothetical protein